MYNRSNKAIKTSDLYIALRDASGKLSTPVAISDDDFLLLPKQYLVLSCNTNHVFSKFSAQNKASFVQMNLPSLGKESGQLVLLDKSLQVLDEVHYDSKQHSDFLRVSDGVSLERLYPDCSSLDPQSWHTAAQTAGYGTPGQQNSQYISPEFIPTEVVLAPNIFSPDNDGLDDVLMINYSFDTPSLMAEIIIFDSSGRKIKQIARQELLATQGCFTWDGTDVKGRFALTGVYIVYFQAYNSSGFSKAYKLPCVLAGKIK